MTISRYWQLVRLNSAGGCQVQPQPKVEAWFVQTCPDFLEETESADPDIQAMLFDYYRLKAEAAQLAWLSLRCFVTHQIRYACIELVRQFGSRYGFSQEDLYPLVLDDDGRPIGQYRPLSVEILESYNPERARLSTWAVRLVKNHPEMNRYLLERGLYRASPWAILNDTTPAQLQRILGEYHQCSAAAIAAAQRLLERYHQVYRQARWQQRQAKAAGRSMGQCEPPTTAQLQAMFPELPHYTVLDRLKGLAEQLRDYRIYARSGLPMTKVIAHDPQTLDDLERRHPNYSGSALAEEEVSMQERFLQTYRTELKTGLDQAITQAIQSRLDTLRRRQPDSVEAFVCGLQLFHCQGLSLGAIAAQVGLKNQVQMTRLLNLKQLRADVGLLLLTALRERLQREVASLISPEQLDQISQALEQALAEEVDQLIANAASEAQIPKGRSAKSLFAYQLCQIIHQFTTRYD